MQNYFRKKILPKLIVSALMRRLLLRFITTTREIIIAQSTNIKMYLPSLVVHLVTKCRSHCYIDRFPNHFWNWLISTKQFSIPVNTSK